MKEKNKPILLLCLSLSLHFAIWKINPRGVSSDLFIFDYEYETEYEYDFSNLVGLA